MRGRQEGDTACTTTSAAASQLVLVCLIMPTPPLQLCVCMGSALPDCDNTSTLTQERLSSDLMPRGTHPIWAQIDVVWMMCTCRELLRHNELLRDKEAFQLAMLESCELGLHHMSTAAATQAAKAAASGGSGGDGGSSSSSHQQMDQKVMSAALLDMQAAELMRVLQPPSSSSQQPSTQPDSSQQQQMQSPQQPGQLQLQRSNSNSTATSSSGLTGSNACSSSTSADTSGSGPEWPAAAAQHNRMKRLLASVTPADVQGVHGLSAEEYAGW